MFRCLTQGLKIATLELQKAAQDVPCSVQGVSGSAPVQLDEDSVSCLQEMRLLRNVLQSTEYGFVLDLAMLANRRQFLNLEKWLPEVIAADQANVISALTTKLDRGITGEGLATVTIKQIMSVRDFSQIGSAGVG
jgi:hypothetical protein